jgi:hypothetical protein
MTGQEQNIIPENIPFEERSKFSFINSFLLSLRMIFLEPSKFFSVMHVNKGLKMPFLFLIIVLALSNAVNYIYIAADMIDSPGEQVVKAMENQAELKSSAESLRSALLKEPSPSDLILSIGFNFLLIYLLAIYWHLILKSMGIALNGLEATVRIFCYTSAVLLTALIPLSNPYTNVTVYVWWTYLMFLGISEAHEVSRRIALRGLMISLFASFIPAILLTLLFFSA